MDHAAKHELELYIVNDGALYRQRTTPIQHTLTRRWVKGTYDHTKAVTLWRYLVDAGALKYAEEHSHRSQARTIFPGPLRNAVAKDLADAWLAELQAGHRHKKNPESDDFHEPEEGDWITEDHRTWMEFGGRERFHGTEIQLRQHMDRQKFWPSVWFLSDHGNLHLLSL